MAAKDMNITIDLETEYNEMVLCVGKVTLGENSRNSMKANDLKKLQHDTVLRALCALLNSGGGVIKAEIENEDYQYIKDGIGEDLEQSFSNILSCVDKYLDFMQYAHTFLIFVKSWCVDSTGLRIVTLQTNLYKKILTSTIAMNATNALDFLKGKKTGSRSFSRRKMKAKRASTHVQEENNVVLSPSELFNKTKLTDKSKVNFSESTHVTFKLTPPKKALKSIKENIPQSVSALANTDGGYLFFGLNGETKDVIGCQVEPCDLSEIEKSIRELPVYHFCEKKEKINYSCKFIKVHKEGHHCGYVCAVKVKRFCCAVFAEEPDSWHIKEDRLMRMTVEEWMELMTVDDPDI